MLPLASSKQQAASSKQLVSYLRIKHQERRPERDLNGTAERDPPGRAEVSGLGNEQYEQSRREEDDVHLHTERVAEEHAAERPALVH